jgi:hypothetical protein
MRFTLHRITFVVICAVAVPLAIWACGEDSPDIPNVSQLPDAADVPADAGIDAPPCTPPVHPEDAKGVFVATNGADGNDCGSRTAPCRTIATALTRATAQKLDIVFIAKGEYDEHVKLAAGKQLVGGWLVDGTTDTWNKACGDNAPLIVTIRARTENTVIDAIDLQGTAKLADLNVQSRTGQAAPGESLYGVFATGSTTVLAIDNVVVDVGNGGDGANGKTGDAGVSGAPCIAVGDGGSGAPGPGGTGGGAGTFDQNGYAAGSGTDGTQGTAGLNGVTGALGTCVDCGACAIPAAGVCGFTINGIQNCGGRGQPGCGGGGGAQGGGATGGGSSIAVYCYNASVTITGGKYNAGNGGGGGAGGPGGGGAPGTAGAKGTTGIDCTGTCNMIGDPVNCTPVLQHGDGGLAGGSGGAGGAGGAGGGGAGGWSVALLQGGTGIVTANNATLKHGNAGKGGTGAPDGGTGANGTAADRYP